MVVRGLLQWKAPPILVLVVLLTLWSPQLKHTVDPWWNRFTNHVIQSLRLIWADTECMNLESISFIFPLGLQSYMPLVTSSAAQTFCRHGDPRNVRLRTVGFAKSSVGRAKWARPWGRYLGATPNALPPMAGCYSRQRTLVLTHCFIEHIYLIYRLIYIHVWIYKNDGVCTVWAPSTEGNQQLFRVTAHNDSSLFVLGADIFHTMVTTWGSVPVN